MRNFIFIVFCISHCFVFSQQSTTKRYSVLKSTITSVGSNSILLKKDKFNILQSIAQPSIIGTRNVGLICVQQGFLNSAIYLKVNNSNNKFFRETLDFVMSPNPFIDYIKIDFAKKTSFDVHIKIFDVNGKTHYSNKFNPTNQIIIPMNRYSIGTYLITIKSGRNLSTNKIFKDEK